MSGINSRFGRNSESKRIKKKTCSFSLSESERNIPLDLNRDSYGELNYDPKFGWIVKNYFGKDSSGVNDENFSTNYLRRSDGLPGSRI